MPTLQEAIDVLAASPKDEAIKLLHEKAQAIWQGIFDKGHGVATEKAKTDIGIIETKVTDLDTKLKAAEAKVVQLSTTNPDVAKLQQEFGTKLEEKEKAHKLELQGLKDQMAGTTRAGALSTLETKLIADGVNPKYAKVLVNDPEVQKRIVVKEGSNSVTVLQKGASTLEMVPADGHSALDLLRTELFEAAKKDAPNLINVTGDRGVGGIKDGDAAPAGDLFDKIRKQVKDEQSTKAAASGEIELEKRLHMLPSNA